MTRNAPSRSRRSGAERSARAAGRAPRDAGFTLLELLIAVTILGLLMVLVLNGLQFGTRVWETGRTGAARMTETEAARAFLRARIEAAQPLVTAAGDGAERTVALGGERDRLRMAVAMPEHLGGGLRLIELSLAGAGATHDLVVRSTPAGAAATGRDGGGEVSVLLADVQAVDFAYYGAGPAGVAAWHAAWDGQEGAPLLVRIAVAFSPGDRRRWPPVTVAPMVDAAE